MYKVSVDVDGNITLSVVNDAAKNVTANPSYDIKRRNSYGVFLKLGIIIEYGYIKGHYSRQNLKFFIQKLYLNYFVAKATQGQFSTWL